MNEKYCPKCKLTISVNLFQKNKCAKDGLQYHCTPCRKLIERSPVKRERDRMRYHNNKDGYRDAFYKRAYGCSLETYNKLLESQNGTCAICFDLCTTGRKLALDHNHTTGAVRGLLCSACNKALGLLKEDVHILENMIKYIKDYPQ
jgi:hypothetical protein